MTATAVDFFILIPLCAGGHSGSTGCPLVNAHIVGERLTMGQIAAAARKSLTRAILGCFTYDHRL
jgi:hypothetical protein